MQCAWVVFVGSSQDQFVDENGVAHTDMQQDWTVIELGDNLFGLERKIDTCDPQDLPINVCT